MNINHATKNIFVFLSPLLFVILSYLRGMFLCEQLTMCTASGKCYYIYTETSEM